MPVSMYAHHPEIYPVNETKEILDWVYFYLVSINIKSANIDQ